MAYAVAALLLAVGILAAGTSKLGNDQPRNARPDALAWHEIAGNAASSPPATAPPTSVVVGRVTGMSNCRWADLGNTAKMGADLTLGRILVLTSGLLEVTYDSGAKVVLQGPVRYDVDSEYGGALWLGKATVRMERDGTQGGGRQRATVEPPGAGSRPADSLAAAPSPSFSVRTPALAAFTGRRAEFGVWVDSSGISYAHVFAGNVDLLLPSLPGRARGKMIMLADDDWVTVELYADRHGRNVNLASGNKPATWVFTRQLPHPAPICSTENEHGKGIDGKSDRPEWQRVHSSTPAKGG